MEYKLNYFGLIKQSLKRKIKNVIVDTKKLEKLLNRRGTSYELEDIKYIVERIYGNTKVNKNEPLSRYYSKHNKEKYKTIMDIIEIIEKDNLPEKIENDVKKLYNETLETVIEYDELLERKKQIAIKYSITLKKVEEIYISLDEKWLENIKLD